mmetsp:Transcript_122240/g.346541  ORF Transcript_122240/g.346541 Transcript_122240/m.346541 type:complete len:240 (-) Transcript_122240:724-1443(-)
MGNNRLVVRDGVLDLLAGQQAVIVRVDLVEDRPYVVLHRLHLPRGVLEDEVAVQLPYVPRLREKDAYHDVEESERNEQDYHCVDSTIYGTHQQERLGDVAPVFTAGHREDQRVDRIVHPAPIGPQQFRDGVVLRVVVVEVPVADLLEVDGGDEDQDAHEHQRPHQRHEAGDDRENHEAQLPEEAEDPDDAHGTEDPHDPDEPEGGEAPGGVGGHDVHDVGAYQEGLEDVPLPLGPAQEL